MVPDPPTLKTFEPAEVYAWLEWFGLGKNDHAQAKVLNEEVTAPYIDQIIEEFHQHLHQNTQLSLLTEKIDWAELKRRLAESLLSLGQEFDTPKYFQDRLQLGTLYASAGVPLRFYPSAYTLMQQCILHHIPPRLQAWDKGAPLISFIMRIMGLSLSLAIEAYYLAKMSAVEQSVTELRTEVIEWQRRAKTDALTNIANRWEIMEALRRWVDISHKQQTPLCLIMADIDWFKHVNDAFGHLAGDEVLKYVAQRIQATLRPIDVLGRYGGEEFLIILPETDLQAATAIAERVRAHVAQCPIHTQHQDVLVTISLGVCEYRDEPDLPALIEQADLAMYEAKKIGRNRVVAERFFQVTPELRA